MRWTLFRTAWLVAWRRARPLLRENPLLALLLAVAVAAAPVGGAVAGAALADSFARALGQPGFVEALALSVASTAFVVGVAVAMLTPEAAGLARQLEPAPVPGRTVALAATVAPVSSAALAVCAFAAPFAIALERRAAATLLLAPLASGAFGAAFAESVRLLVRRGATGALYAAAVAAAWAAGGAAHGAAEAGAAAALVPALQGRDSVLAPVSVVAWTLVAGALWVAAAATPRRARRATRDVRRTVRLPSFAPAAFALATAICALRHRQLRLHVAATVSLPIAATVALAFALDLRHESLVAFCCALALPAAAVVPAATRGLAADGAALARSSPASGRLLALGSAVAGVAVAFALVGVAVAATAPVARASASLYGELEAATAFTLGCAAFAGALVPWRAERVVQQLASYGAIAAVAVPAAFGVARLEPVLGAGGLDGVAFSLAAGNVVLAAGIASTALVRL